MKDEVIPTIQEEQAIREIVEYRCRSLVDEGYDFEPLIQAFAGHQKQEIAKAIETWHTRKLKEAVLEEWKLISEVAHSANITAELYIGRAREERLAELEERTDDPA